MNLKNKIFALVLIMIFSIGLCDSTKKEIIVKFWEYYSKTKDWIISNDQNILTAYEKEVKDKRKTILKKGTVSYVNGAVYIYKNKIIFNDGTIYSLDKYNPGKNQLVVLLKYIPERNILVVVFKGNTTFFNKIFFAHDTLYTTYQNRKIVSLDPLIEVYTFNLDKIEQRNEEIKRESFYQDILNKIFGFFEEVKSTIFSFFGFFNTKENKYFDKDKTISRLYWSGALSSVDCKSHSISDIEESMKYYYNFIKNNAFASKFSKMKPYLNKIKENCIYDKDKINSECVWYQFSDVFKRAGGPACLFGEDINTILNNKRVRCGQISLVLASVYRELYGYVLYAPYEPVGYPSSLDVSNIKRQYEKYKKKDHKEVGIINHVYIVGTYDGSKGHSFLVFCNKKFDKTKVGSVSDYIRQNCVIVDSVSFSPIRSPNRGIYNVDYTLILATENDICIVASKFLEFYYGVNYNKYIGVPSGHVIGCASDFV